MPTVPKRPASRPKSSQRTQTDESLRVEREKADHALGADLQSTDETADAVIVVARERADAVLAAARAQTDVLLTGSSEGALATSSRKTERAREDQTVKDERADADETLRVKRAEQATHRSEGRRETDRDLLSERVLSDEALATRDEFLSLVSHDLRNMLNLVVGFAGLIAQGANEPIDPAQGVAYAQRIQRAGGRMNRLIGDLVDVASIEAGRLAVTRETADAAAVVLEAVDSFQLRAEEQEVSLVAAIGRPIPLHSFDPARILQVLVNLISNALKFTPAQGRIEVRVEADEGALHFSVGDSGQGIPADQLEVIFERYRQVKTNDRRGSGLGLYVSRSIILGHGGKLWAESLLGVGSRFYFTLPSARA